MAKHRQNIESSKSEKLVWLANQIFTAFPEEVHGLKFHVLECGCIYYQRISPDGTLDPKSGIYRDAVGGPCEICMLQQEKWQIGVIDEVVAYRNENGVMLCRQYKDVK